MLAALSGALLTGLAQGAMIALVALGYTMVYGVLKLINFAHSEVFMMAAYFGLIVLAILFGDPPAFGGMVLPSFAVNALTSSGDRFRAHPLLATGLTTIVAMFCAAAL